MDSKIFVTTAIAARSPRRPYARAAVIVASLTALLTLEPPTADAQDLGSFIFGQIMRNMGPGGYRYYGGGYRHREYSRRLARQRTAHARSVAAAPAGNTPETAGAATPAPSEAAGPVAIKPATLNLSATPDPKPTVVAPGSPTESSPGVSTATLEASKPSAAPAAPDAPAASAAAPPKPAATSSASTVAKPGPAAPGKASLY